MFEKLKTLFKKPKEEEKKSVVKKPRKPRAKKKESIISDKEKATLANEPYISIVKVDVDPNNINSGAFELDWNDKFVLNLIKSGYKIREDDKDQDIVDRWFQTVCRNIALEVYEQEVADPDNRYRNDMRTVYSKDLGNGRSEVR